MHPCFFTLPSDTTRSSPSLMAEFLARERLQVLLAPPSLPVKAFPFAPLCQILGKLPSFQEKPLTISVIFSNFFLLRLLPGPGHPGNSFHPGCLIRLPSALLSAARAPRDVPADARCCQSRTADYSQTCGSSQPVRLITNFPPKRRN